MKKSNFTKILALVLTVLMVVGVVPLSIFAVDATPTTAPNLESNALSELSDFAKANFKANSKYWIKAVDSANPTMKGSYATGYNSVRLDNFGGSNTNGVVTVKNGTDTGWCGYTNWINGASGYKGGYGNTYYNAWKKNTASLDFAFTADIKIDPSMDNSDATGISGLGPQITSGYEARGYHFVRIKVSGEAGAKKYELYAPKGGVPAWYAFTDACLGEKLCDLSSTEYTNVKVLWDATNTDNKGGAIFIYVNGELKATVNASEGFCATDNKTINCGIGNEKTWNATDGTDYALGGVVYGFQYSNAPGSALVWQAADVRGYYYDSDADGQVTDESRVSAPDFVYYNDFDSMAAGTYKTTAANDYAIYKLDGNKYITYTDQTKVDDGNGGQTNRSEFQIVDENGNKVMKMNGGNVNSYLDVSIGQAYSTYKANSGKNFVLQFDVKGEFGAEQAVVNFNDRMSTNHNITPLKRQSNGKIYIPMAKGENRIAYGSEEGEKVYVGQITKDEYITIGVLMNSAENYVVIYINGVAVSGQIKMFSDTVLAEIKGVEGFENGYAATEARMFYNHVGKDLYIDNIMFYNGDKYVAKEFNATLTETFRTPTKEEYVSALDTNLAFYSDYEGLATTSTVANINAAATKNGAYGYENISGSGIVADGTNTAFLFANNGANTGASLYITSGTRKTTTANQGKNFVVSVDYKLNGAIKAGQLLVLNSWRQANVKNSDKYENQTAVYTAVPLWVDTNGNVYTTNTNWTTEMSETIYDANPDNENKVDGTKSHVNEYTGGCVWKQNAWNFTKNNGEILDKTVGDNGVIAKLNEYEYTNITVQVLNNKWMVYVNGVQAFDEWKLFMSETAATAYFDDYGTTGYAATAAENDTEFALTHISHIYDNKATPSTTHLMVDNTAIYWGDEVVKAYDTTLYDDVFQTGYKVENGGIYSYDYGKLVKNGVSPDGLLTTDANGKVLFNGTAVTSMDEIYTTDENGDIIMANGVYPGYYRANALLGKTDGTLYYYNGGSANRDTDSKRFDLFQKTYYMDGVICTTLSDILDNVPDGYRVKVCENLDFTGEAVAFFTNVTLELQTFNITAESFYVGGNTTIKTGGGVINVPKGGLIYDKKTDGDMYFYVDGKGYEKYTVKGQHQTPNTTMTNDSFTVEFRPTLNEDTTINQTMFSGGAAARDVEIRIKMVIHTAEGDVVKYAVFDDAIIAKAYGGEDGTQYALKATIKLKVEYTSVDVSYEVATLDSTLGGQVYSVALGTFTPAAQA